jgi:hypothetical protein
MRIKQETNISLEFLLSNKLGGLYYNPQFNFNIYKLWHNLGHYALRNTRIVKAKMQTQFWWGNLKKRDHIEDLGVDGRMILKWTLKT